MARLHPHHRLFNLLSPLSAWFPPSPAPLDTRLRMLSTVAAYTVHVSMHGMMSKSDISVVVSDGVLLIEAERTEQSTSAAASQRRTHPTVSVSHSHTLPHLRTAAQASQPPIDGEEVNGDGNLQPVPTAAAALDVNAQDAVASRVERCVVLPADSDVTAMTARWTDGVLEVVIPRRQREAAEAMSIEIQ